MLMLLSPPRRAWLQSFAVVVGAMGGLALGAGLALAFSGPGLTFGLFLGLLLAAGGLLHPRAMLPLYAGWMRLAELYMRAVRLLMKAICFVVVFAVGAGKDGALRVEPPDPTRSLWLPRTAAAHAAAVPSQTVRRWWGWTYASWAVRSGKWWALALLPFLLVLAVVDTEAEPTLPSQTYTLF